MDLLVQPDNTVHAIATDPSTLYTISPNHRNYSVMDLYEYFPLMGPGTRQQWSWPRAGGRIGPLTP